MNRAAVFVDLDSTLCDTSQRGAMVKEAREAGVEPDWDAYAMRCDEDTPVAGVVALVQMLHGMGASVYMVSGRSDVAKVKTKEWLDKYGVPYHGLFLRSSQSEERNGEFKATTIKDLLHYSDPFDHVLMLDDMPSVVAAVEHLTPTLLVNPPYHWHKTNL